MAKSQKIIAAAACALTVVAVLLVIVVLGGDDDADLASTAPGDRQTTTGASAPPGQEPADLPSLQVVAQTGANPETDAGTTTTTDPASNGSVTTGGPTTATAAPSATSPADRSNPGAKKYDSARNSIGRYTQNALTPQSGLNIASAGKTINFNDFYLKSKFFDVDGFGGRGHLTNGINEGQFRVFCDFSHLNEDDPIMYPGQPGRSHLHMYFGNTQVDAFTTETDLLNKGGGTCNGFELNRTGYWAPTLLDGQGNFILPESIVVYYKSHNPAIVEPIPQGLKMIAGNPQGGAFAPSGQLYWACGKSGAGHLTGKSNQIKNCGGDGILNLTIQFPNCWDGRLHTTDQSHVKFMNGQTCPASHPRHIPQVTYLIYFENAGNTDGWYLSSDQHPRDKPGNSAHADWWGGWNKSVIDVAMHNCIKPGMSCSQGQTGTDRILAPIQQNQDQRLPKRGKNPLPAATPDKYKKRLGATVFN